MNELDYNPFRQYRVRKENKEEAIRDLNQRRMTDEQRTKGATRRRIEDILMARKMGLTGSDL